MNSLSDIQPGHARNDSGALAQSPAESSTAVAAEGRALSPLTFGGCIASAYNAYGAAYAEGLLRFAVNSGIVCFPGRRCVEIGPRDPRELGTGERHDATGLFHYFLQDDRQHRPATILGGAGAPPVSAQLARARVAVSEA